MTIATVRDHVGRPGAVLSPSETARLLREDHGVTDAELAHQVHELTAGGPSWWSWPARRSPATAPTGATC